MGIFNLFGKGKNPNHRKIEVAPGIHVSPELAALWPQMEARKRSFIQIEARPATDLPLAASKFGGPPLLPRHVPYPLDSQGNKMFPLAQLNFAEIPQLDGYPAKGWLQIYTSPNDVYGIDFDHPASQTDFRVMFFEEINENDVHTDFGFIEELYEHSPIIKTHALSFTKAIDYGGLLDAQFNEAVPTVDLDDKLYDEVDKHFSGAGHKIGGYAFFTQDDPRTHLEQFSHYILLLQIDSIGDDICWGDCGVANFFIDPDKLKQKDFSNVLYNWDCT